MKFEYVGISAREFRMDRTKTYWNNNGQHQAIYDRLSEALVPMSGGCETVEGELLRAISKVYYDYYNNGLGNDMRGPVAFLQEHFPLIAHYKPADLEEAAPENRDGDTINEQTLEDLTTAVIQYVDAKNGEYTLLVGGDMWAPKYKNRIKEPTPAFCWDDEEEEGTW